MKSCAKLYESGKREDGVYNIDPDGLGTFKVWCDMKHAGGWTVFQRRQDGSEDFYRGWSDYKVGFGDVNGEFWLGLDKLHRLSNSGQNILRIDLMDFDGSAAYAKYGSFSVASEADNYELNVDSFEGKYRIVSFELKQKKYLQCFRFLKLSEQMPFLFYTRYLIFYLRWLPTVAGQIYIDQCGASPTSKCFEMNDT